MTDQSDSTTALYQVWVLAEDSSEWEQYTLVGFLTRKNAEQWAREYIPNAQYEVRP